jgi:hypothetical protein
MSNKDKVITRSSSYSSSKIEPLSLEVFNKSMSDLRTFQKSTSTEIKALHLSMDSKFSEIKASMLSLTSQISQLKEENASLRTDLIDLSKRVKDLESTSSKDAYTDCLPNLLQELSDRENLSRNVIVHGIPESSSSQLANRLSDDAKLLSETFQPFMTPLPTNLKSIRLGKPNNRGPRPLKVFLSSKDVALKLISDFNSFERSQSPNDVPNPISISRDRTKQERENIKRIYAELDCRKKKR